MTEEERAIMNLLIEAYKRFLKLDATHQSHIKDFADGIHRCQDQIIHRIVQRDYPDDFPMIKHKLNKD